MMDDDVLKSISSKVSALHQPHITITCYIPTNCVGAVIGRRGTTIAQIQRYAQQVAGNGGQVRVSIVGHDSTPTSGDESMSENTTTTNNNNNNNFETTNEDDDPSNENMNNSNKNNNNLSNSSNHGSGGNRHANSNSTNNNNNNNNNGSSVPYTYSELDWSSPHWTPVVIRADPCGALAAAQRLQEMVDELDDVIIDIPLSRSKHATLVGKRGLVLANLSADTNVRIMVPRRELRHDVVQLEGELNKCKLCLDRVLTIAHEAKNNFNNNNNNSNSGNASTTANSSNNNNNNRKNGRSSEKDDVSNTILVSQLPSQTKLRSVGRKTDTIIKKKKMDENWQLTISGTNQEQVQSAIAILQKWMEDVTTNGSTNSNNINNTNNSNSNGNIANNGESNTNNNSNSSGNRSRNRGGRGGQQRSNNGNSNNNNNNNNNNREKSTKGKNNKANTNRSESMS